MINTSLEMVTLPELILISTTSSLSFSKYKKGIPIPEVAFSSWALSFQFIVTVQSEKSDTVAFEVFNPSKPTSIGAESPITPEGM